MILTKLGKNIEILKMKLKSLKNDEEIEDYENLIEGSLIEHI
jgi:hypothetical protein